MTKEKLVKELDRWLRGGVNESGKVDGNGSLGALTDMKKAQGADLGIFILGSCFIDAMAGFRYGITREMLDDEKIWKFLDKEENKHLEDEPYSRVQYIHKEYLSKKYADHRDSGRRYIDFVKEYLPQYKDQADIMYSYLRNGLVHNYVEHEGKYMLNSARDGTHLLEIEVDGKKRMQINRDKFVMDLEEAYNKFIDHILKDDSIFEKARLRLEKLGLMKIPE